MKLAENIIDYLLGDEQKAITIVYDPKGFLLRTDVCFALEHLGKVHILSGSLLDLRIAYERIPNGCYHGRPVFILRNKSAKIMPDIQEHALVIEEFRLVNYFRWYDIDTLLQKNFDELEYCYRHQASYKLNAQETEAQIQAYHDSPEFHDNAIKTIIEQWDQLFGNVIFDKLDWIPKAADIICQAIEAGCYELFEEHIASVNRKFQLFLKQNYLSSIVTSSCPSKGSPRIVTHVLPFIYKQPYEKKALIVVDGMNIWQAGLLAKSFIEKGYWLKMDYIYAWLPSVTELSRQAIFRGDAPDDNYAQNPSNEQKLFNAFFYHKPIDAASYEYCWGSVKRTKLSTKLFAAVDTTLDNAMHGAKNNAYLFDDTKRWLIDGFIEDVEQLLRDGFVIYITSDHGNVSTKPYKNLPKSTKIGADEAYRYITLSPQASPAQFAEENIGHVIQLDPDSRTFYPIDNEAFSNQPSITHGGTHWLEAIVPFFTIENSGNDQ